LDVLKVEVAMPWELSQYRLRCCCAKLYNPEVALFLVFNIGL